MPPVVAPREALPARLLRWFGIGVLAPLLLVAAIPAALHVVHRPDFGFKVRALEVVAVDEGGPAALAGVQAGDRIVAVGDVEVADTVEFYRERARVDAGDRLTLDLARDGARTRRELEPRRAPRQQMVFDLSLWLDGLAFLMIGWWVYAKRHDAVARYFFGLCLTFAFFLIDVPDSPHAGFMQAKEHVRALLQLLWPALFLRFFQLFPATVHTPPELGRRHLLFVPAIALAVLVNVADLAGAPERGAAMAALSFVVLAYFVAYFVAGLVVFARKALRRDRPVEQTKLRVVLVGLLCGLVPFLLAMAAGSVSPWLPVREYLGFPLLLVPASFALAIMRYGALDTGFVVRTSLTYVLLTVAILAAYFLAVGGIGRLITAGFPGAAEPVAAVAIAACSLLVLPLRRRLQRWIDLAFYPSRRADREALADLARTLAEQVEADPAYRLLLGRLHDLYRPSSLALLLGDGDPPRALVPAVAIAGGQPRTLGCALPLASPLAGVLDRLRRPVYREEVDDELPPTTSDPAGRALLAASGATLLVPLISGNRLIGALLFGPKPDGSLYSQTDLANLSSLALQAASQLRSLGLVHESLLRRQLETELAVARDIQARLLPTAALTTPRYRVAGCMAPCRHVGGDYFDYFPLGDSSLGLCIADVAGKGIPAALLMTTVRVAFRAEALPGRSPETVVQSLARRLHDVLAEGQFVSFFYATFDAERGELAYCNAGMDPPLLFRVGEARQEALRKGGPVLGVVPDHRYRRGTILLRPDDLLLLYTDGITDQTAPATGEFFDLERLEALARRGRDLPPQELCGRIFAAVEAFGGDEASDDRTVMVLQVAG